MTVEVSKEKTPVNYDIANILEGNDGELILTTTGEYDDVAGTFSGTTLYHPTISTLVGRHVTSFTQGEYDLIQVPVNITYTN